MYTTKLGKDVLEAQKVNKWKPIIFSCVLFLLFVSRAIYDIISVAMTVINKEKMHAYGFGSSWMATDMVTYNLTFCYRLQGCFSSFSGRLWVQEEVWLCVLPLNTIFLGSGSHVYNCCILQSNIPCFNIKTIAGQLNIMNSKTNVCSHSLCAWYVG